MANERHRDLLASAERSRSRGGSAESCEESITIRMATAGDRRAIERLAELDSTCDVVDLLSLRARQLNADGPGRLRRAG